MAFNFDLDLAGAAGDGLWNHLIANGVANKNQKYFSGSPDPLLRLGMALDITLPSDCAYKRSKRNWRAF
jgi:hypothetical protein